MSRTPAPTCLGDPRLVDVLDRWIVTPGLAPSCAVAVIDAGRMVEAAVVQADLPVSEGAPPVFDLASVTKPLSATVALHLVAEGRLSLDATLGSLLPEVDGTPAAGARVEDLLSHRAGLPAWGALYLDDPFAVAPTPSVPWSGSWPSLATMLRRAASRCGPAGPEVYSDLGYVLLGAALARTAGALRAAIAARTGIGPPVPRARVVPTEDVPWRGGALRGRVHDENAYALEEVGGEPGHAGAFATAAEVAAFGASWLRSLAGAGPLPRALAERAVAPRPGGTHGLGWDTRSGPRPSSGGGFGPRTFGHLGFTGTSLWIDPDAGRVVCLLANRVAVGRADDRFRVARGPVHDAVLAAVLDRTGGPR